MTTLPNGTVTFLFTDLEGSTRLWEEHPSTMRAALAHHDHLVRDAIERHSGIVVKTTGDGVHAVFTSPVDALVASIAAQRDLDAEAWDGTPPLRVRMGVHTGVAELRDGDYYGTVLNRAARLTSIAHGGQVVCSEATASLARDALTSDITLADLGEHRLRDLSKPERVFQVDGLGRPSGFPGLSSLDLRTTNLPLQHTSFLGRERDVADVVALCADHALVTLTGVGGVGKTRLALQAAAEMLPRFTNGVWLCELAPAGDPDAVVEIVAEVLDAGPRPGMSTVEAIVEVLRTKRLLLLLDNCEHVLDAVADLVDAVVTRCPEVRVLATSREGLGLDGEHVRPLRSLALPGGDDEPATSAAVQLFADRARSTRGTFVLDDESLPPVIEICRRLDGIPLAIELAAARIVAMQPSEIASRLDQRFRLLTGTRRRAVERHQTLRATVEWSYSLLTPREQLVFDRLAVFAGSFDAGAATAVVGDDAIGPWDVLDALESLVSKSMVNADEQQETTRYSLLETLRTFGQERLEARGGAEDLRARHARCYAELARTAGAALFGPDEIETVVRLRRELDNLRAATFWSLDSDGDHAEALAIVAALASMASFDRSSGLSGWADQAVAYVGETTPGQAAAVLGAASWCAMDRGDVDTARTRALAALDGVHEPDCTEPAQTIVLLGVQGMYTGDSSHIAAMMDHIDRFADEQSSLYVQSVLCSSFSSLAAVSPELAPRAEEYAAPRTGARRAVRQSDCTRERVLRPRDGARSGPCGCIRAVRAMPRVVGGGCGRHGARARAQRCGAGRASTRRLPPGGRTHRGCDRVRRPRRRSPVARKRARRVGVRAVRSGPHCGRARLHRACRREFVELVCDRRRHQSRYARRRGGPTRARRRGL